MAAAHKKYNTRMPEVAELMQVRGHYRNVPYHNFFHVVDVTHATFRYVVPGYVKGQKHNVLATCALKARLILYYTL